MTAEDLEAEQRFFAAIQLRNDRELNQLVMSFAFAIDDPCSETEIRLSRALIRFGRLVAPHLRVFMAEQIEKTCDEMSESQPPSS